jgi:signal transduction histidine kinase
LAEDRRRMQERLASLAGELTQTHAKLEEAHQQLRGRVAQLVMLYQIGRDLASRPNWDEALESFLTTLTGFLSAEGAALFLSSSGGTRVTARSVCGLKETEVDDALVVIARRAAARVSDSTLLPLSQVGAADPRACVDHEELWHSTVLPLCQRQGEIGYLLLKKSYEDRGAFENDYYFLITIQTVLAEEVTSAQAMTELRKLKDFHERTFDHVRSGIFTVDSDGAVGFANRRVRELFGRDPSGTLVAEFLDLGPEAPAIHTWMNGVVTGSTRSVDAWLRPLNGSGPIPVSLVGSPLPGELPGETHVVCVLEDQRQTRALDAERRRAARQKEHLIMAAEWAHDVRTPLTGILHSAELLADALEAQSPKRRHFEVVESEVRRINELVSNFLDYARPADLKCAPIALTSLVDAVVELQSGPALGRGLDLRPDCQLSSKCRVDLDLAAMKQVLLNLVQNAMDASPDAAEVVVRAREIASDPSIEGGRSVQIDVIDAGPGVAEENIDRLFIPFFTTKAQGTGLGLAISEKVARAHGGHLRYLREHDRTVMRVVLPLREDEVATFGVTTPVRRGMESELEAKG